MGTNRTCPTDGDRRSNLQGTSPSQGGRSGKKRGRVGRSVSEPPATWGKASQHSLVSRGRARTFAFTPKTPLTQAPFPPQLAQYEVLRRLGEGGMAEVFVAKKRGAEGTYKVVVVKRILPSFGASRRFQSMFIDEAQLATRLNHPNVVQVYDFSNEGPDGHILAMEYVCLLYTSPSPRDRTRSRMPSSA